MAELFLDLAKIHVVLLNSVCLVIELDHSLTRYLRDLRRQLASFLNAFLNLAAVDD